MANFEPRLTLLRSHPRCEVMQFGAGVQLIGENVDRYGQLFLVDDIRANPRHFAKNLVPAFDKAGAVAVVYVKIDNVLQWVVLTAEQWARGEDERARYEAWLEGVQANNADRQAKEREYDAGHNEGGDGYNPYRTGDTPTYRK